MWFDWDGFFVVGAVFLIFILSGCCRRPTRQCPRCREVNREAAIFCSQCGARLPER